MTKFAGQPLLTDGLGRTIPQMFDEATGGFVPLTSDGAGSASKFAGQSLLTDGYGRVIPQLFDETSGGFIPLTTENNGGGSGGGSSFAFLVGSAVPTASNGQDGDMYYCSANYNLYKKTAGAWAVGGNLRGATGPAGTAGVSPTIAVGTTTTGAAGTNAAVTPTVAGNVTTLAFTVPRGATGATGPAGFPTQAQWDALVTRVTALETP